MPQYTRVNFLKNSEDTMSNRVIVATTTTGLGIIALEYEFEGTKQWRQPHLLQREVKQMQSGATSLSISFLPLLDVFERESMPAVTDDKLLIPVSPAIERLGRAFTDHLRAVRAAATGLILPGVGGVQ